MVISYDGTDFLGWQIQKRGRTVQGEICRALEKMHRHPVKVTGAGRTDSGVHALGQVINFETDIDSLPAERYWMALNSYLPGDVKSFSSRQVDHTFSARYSAVSREYRYYILFSPVPQPVNRFYSWRVNSCCPDPAALNRLASQLVGEHDFSTFTFKPEPGSSTIRTITSASFYPDGPFIVFRIVGNGFLRKMVRALAGTMVGLVLDGGDSKDLIDRLEKKDNKYSYSPAPAEGLFLYEVVYDE